MEKKKNKTCQQNTRETPGTAVLLEMEYTGEDYSARGSGFFVAPDKIVTLTLQQLPRGTLAQRWFTPLKVL